MDLEGVGRELRRVAEDVGASVVGIGQRWGVGSGVIMGEGKVITNAHNVRREEVTVTLPDGRNVKGRVTGADVDKDVAMLAIEDGSTRPIEWSPDCRRCKRSDTPCSHFRTRAAEVSRVTFGFVSGTERSFRGPRGRRIAGSIEHTAPLLPGSSGRPDRGQGRAFPRSQHEPPGRGVLPGDPRGRFTQGQSRLTRPRRSTATRTTGRRARPRRCRPRLAPSGRPPRARWTAGPSRRGRRPAEAAGVKEGDLLVKAGGRDTTDYDTLFEVLETAKGDLELVVVRGVDEHTLNASLVGQVPFSCRQP